MIWWFSFYFLCSQGPEWGFFGHRLINRVAVYTLPGEMINWYKPYIDYLSDHAVDPDKRRYASQHEGVRHFIDLDRWGTFPFDHLPRKWEEALALNLRLSVINGADTNHLLEPIPHELWDDAEVEISERTNIVRMYYLKVYYDDEPSVPCDTLRLTLPYIHCRSGETVLLRDDFSHHGILPYHLVSMQHRLTRAFQELNVESIIRISAELGHYIGDACVPLHTTSNYNGQLTDQVGIHAFWESRIPELFALDQFDMVVGTAEYIPDPVEYYWGIVLDSHREVNRVLTLEKSLSERFPRDKQYCFEDRLHQMVKTQCAAYAEAYHLAMDKMVEDRFRAAVKALGNAWYTAWVDAGQPVAPLFGKLNERHSDDPQMEHAYKNGKIKGRDHEP